LKIPRQNSQYSTASSRGFRFNQAPWCIRRFIFFDFDPKRRAGPFKYFIVSYPVRTVLIRRTKQKLAAIPALPCSDWRKSQ
jgi:hypothetical protein